MGRCYGKVQLVMHACIIFIEPFVLQMKSSCINWRGNCCSHVRGVDILHCVGCKVILLHYRKASVDKYSLCRYSEDVVIAL